MDDFGMGSFWFIQSMAESGDNARLRQENQALKKAIDADKLQLLQKEGLVAPDPPAKAKGDGAVCGILFLVFMLVLGVWLFVTYRRIERGR